MSSPWGSNWPTGAKGVWNDGSPFEEFLGNPDAPSIARKHLAHGGGKGGGGTTYNSQTTTIPPEVLARYNSVNATAQTAAAAPFVPYGGEFVAPVNSTQQGGINTTNAAVGSANPYYTSGTTALSGGLSGAQPYYGTAGDQISSGLATGTAANSQALSTLNSGLGGAQPYNASAGNAYTSAYTGAQPYQIGATGLAAAGTGAVNAAPLDINSYMNPYNQSVVNSTLGLLDQKQGVDLRNQRDSQIMSGGYGGDGANIGRAVLQGQQDLNYGNVAAGLYNTNYNQALGAAQQQQGVGLGAAQSNRTALQTGATQLQNIGNQGYTQGLGLGTAQQGLGNQIYNQGLGAANGQLNIGQAGYTQGVGAAGANQGLGSAIFGAGNTAANSYGSLGTGYLNSQLNTGAAQTAAGTIAQQTGQAQDTALYNQFLQQQGYPFQTAQFLANIAEGTGALSGSTTGGYSASPQPFFSDERLKEDIRTIGHTHDGLRIVTYRYKGSPHTQIGMLAQDVEKKRPEAVGLAGGYKTVDYDAATRKALGGAVANDNAWGGYAAGGSPGSYDPTTLAQLVLAHQAMYPGAAHDRQGVTSGAGPRGLQLSQSPTRSLPTPQAPRPAPAAQSTLGSALHTIGDVSGAVKSGKEAYSAGKDAYGIARDAYDRVAHGSTDSQIADWSKYGSRPGDAPAGGLGAAGSTPSAAVNPVVGAGTSSTSVAPLETDSGASIAAAPPIDADVGTSIADSSLISDALDFARRGGRIKRYASGGAPYDNAEGYIPDDLYAPLDPNKLAAEQKAMEPGKSTTDAGTSKSGKDGTGKALGSALGSIAGSFIPIPGGSMIGGLLGGGLGSMFNKGGRAGYDDGGTVVVDPDDRSYYDRIAPEAAGGKRPVESAAVPALSGSNVIPFPTRGLVPNKPDDFDADIHGRYSDTLPDELPKAATGLAPLPAPRAVAAPDGFDVPENVAKRHWVQESGDRQFKPDGSLILSPKGAAGRSQIAAAGPEAAKAAGLPWDPERVKTDEPYNRALGDAWLKHLNDVYGDPYKASAAYNAGQGAVDNATRMAMVKGGNYWNHLPAETQNHLYIVSGGKIGSPSAPGMTSRALAMVGDRPPPGGAAAAAPAENAAPSGLAPIPTGVDLALPGKDNPKGDWLDRNERYVVSGLTFLGNMLASPSHQLTGAIGSGLAAAAPAYAEYGRKEREAQQAQQGIQLGGQRLDIQQRAQYIGLLTQLRTMQNARLGRGLPEDPALAAQISHIAKIVGGAESPSAGPAAPAPSPTSGSAAATPPAPPPAPPVAAGNPAPPPSPSTSAAAPPAGGAPADLAAKHPALSGLPPQVSSPEFLAQLHPEQNPIELYKRADAIVDDGDPNGAHARAVARADTAVQSMKERGYAYDKNMMPIIVPGMPQTQRAMQMVPQNTAWTQKESIANNERQGARQSLDLIRKVLEDYQTNALGDVSSDVQRYARAIGIDIPDGAKMNAAAVQEIIKQSAARAASAGDTDMARGLSRLASIDPTKEPEANKQILAQSYADVNARDAKYNYLQPRISAVPQLDTPYEEQKWVEANPREKFYEDAYKNIAVRGGTPELSKMKEGHTYIIEPGAEPAYNLPRGSLKGPTKLRRVQRDGQWGWEPVR